MAETVTGPAWPHIGWCVERDAKRARLGVERYPLGADRAAWHALGRTVHRPVGDCRRIRARTPGRIDLKLAVPPVALTLIICVASTRSLTTATSASPAMRGMTCTFISSPGL